MKTRKQYIKEFKLDAISLVLNQGLTIAEADRNVTVQRSHLHNHNFLDYSPLHYLTGG
ncbi:MAG: hypothetical protein WAT53_01675 [Nitrosomonas sp.]|nr:hypothetical protein [Nitrosomonas sp.]MCC7135822.1 hypothetical protein [Nitrosomonas sp.]